MTAMLLPVMTLWQREIVRFVRQRSRLIGAFAQPVVLWLLLGVGLGASFQPAGAVQGASYGEYLYPGMIVLALLFTAIFATIAVIEDRKSGFLQGVLVAPVSRMSIVLGQALGGATLALLQGVLFLILAPLAGITLSVTTVVAAVAVMALLSFALTCLGLTIAWRMDSVQGFHAIMNLILMPIWFLSGAFFPRTGLPEWLIWLMQLNPLTYGMAALRRCFYLGNDPLTAAIPPFVPSLLVTFLFAVGAFLIAAYTARQKIAL